MSTSYNARHSWSSIRCQRFCADSCPSHLPPYMLYPPPPHCGTPGSRCTLHIGLVNPKLLHYTVRILYPKRQTHITASNTFLLTILNSSSFCSSIFFHAIARFLQSSAVKPSSSSSRASSASSSSSTVEEKSPEPPRSPTRPEALSWPLTKTFGNDAGGVAKRTGAPSCCGTWSCSLLGFWV